MDFILKQPNKIIPIEVKYSSIKLSRISRSLRNFIEIYKPPRVLVLTKGFWGKVKVGNTDIVFAPVWYVV